MNFVTMTSFVSEFLHFKVLSSLILVGKSTFYLTEILQKQCMYKLCINFT